jgi:hypothetical protein
MYFFHLFFYGCDVWFLTSRREHDSNRLLRKMFGYKRAENKLPFFMLLYDKPLGNLQKI